MLTVVPGSIFKKLLKGSVHEDNASLKPFSWDEMVKHSETYKDILDYIEKETSNAEMVGVGSARAAFMLKEGTRDSSGNTIPPSCFKVAINDKGIAQNDAEISMFEEYKLACFPKLYDYDKAHKYFMLVELGTTESEAYKNGVFDFDDYIEQWKAEANKDMFLRNFADVYDVRDIEGIGTIIYRIGEQFYQDHEIDAVRDFLERISQKYPKYKTIFAMAEFCKKAKGRMKYADFLSERNWGIVVRDGEAVPIPIDFGATTHVIEKYYWNGTYET